MALMMQEPPSKGDVVALVIGFSKDRLWGDLDGCVRVECPWWAA